MDEALKQLGVGDALDRSLFLASLDYQLASFANRLQSVREAEESALGQDAGSAAAQTVDEPSKEQFRQICEAFVADLACAYDACFEKPPTPDEQGPFGRLLADLCDCVGLKLYWDGDLLHRAITAGGLSSQSA
jgi:hypothetical protein